MSNSDNKEQKVQPQSEQNIEDSIYDDQEAVAFIQKNLPQEYQGTFTDDEITYITDLIFEFFESQGLLDDDDDELDVNVDEILEFVMKNSKRDSFTFDEEGVKWVIEGEFDYEDSID